MVHEDMTCFCGKSLKYNQFNYHIKECDKFKNNFASFDEILSRNIKQYKEKIDNDNEFNIYMKMNKLNLLLFYLKQYVKLVEVIIKTEYLQNLYGDDDDFNDKKIKLDNYEFIENTCLNDEQANKIAHYCFEIYNEIKNKYPDTPMIENFTDDIGKNMEKYIEGNIIKDYEVILTLKINDVNNPLSDYEFEDCLIFSISDIIFEFILTKKNKK